MHAHPDHHLEERSRPRADLLLRPIAAGQDHSDGTGEVVDQAATNRGFIDTAEPHLGRTAVQKPDKLPVATDEREQLVRDCRKSIGRNALSRHGVGQSRPADCGSQFRGECRPYLRQPRRSKCLVLLGALGERVRQREFQQRLLSVDVERYLLRASRSRQ